MGIHSPIRVATDDGAANHHRTAELDRLGDEIAELAAHLDAATARLLDLIREFDARGGWGNGFKSCAHWLTWRIGLAPGAAREHVRVARALGTLPLLAQALACGELSYSKVCALTRVATPETEERLLAVGRAGTAEHVERIVRGWRKVDRQAEAREAAQRHKSRALYVYHDDDGMVVLRGRLEPEVGALVMQGPVRPRRGHARSRGNVPAPGLRRHPGNHAPRPRRPPSRSRRPDADNPARSTQSAPAPRSRLPLPGLWRALRPGPSHPPLGSRWPDDALEPRAALSPAPSSGPRGRLSGRSTGERDAAVSVAGRPAAPRGSIAGRGACRSGARPSIRSRRAGAEHPPTDLVPRLAGRAAGRGLGDRRPASTRSRVVSRSRGVPSPPESAEQAD